MCSTRTSSKAWRRSLGNLVLAGVALPLAGCLNRTQSMMDPAGPQAGRIHSLYLVFFWVCVVVYVLVVLVLTGALLRRPIGSDDHPITQPDARGEARLWTVVTSCIVISVIALLSLMVGDFATGRAIHRMGDAKDALSIKIVGHQWWWEVQYEDPVASNVVTTANEIHIPVDPAHPQPVKIELSSGDVIHSFWVPNLHGKKDLVPGHPTEIWIEADQPGQYLGQCAEFCGYQHALMRMVVVAEPRTHFDEWLQAQRKSAREPSNEVERRGQQVFLKSSCVLCHTIAGTRAGGRVGPDLTHVGSRDKLAAETIPNTLGHLAGWIVDPQRIKPGARMPQNELSPQDLRALIEYLQSLK
jgi:cytochrome c oxidase subunit 2